MRLFSSTLLCALLFACGSKSSTDQDTAEPPADQESQESQPAEDPVAEDSIAKPKMGSLDRSIISAKVKEVLPDIKTCHNEGLVAQPDLTGRVVIKMVIGKDGVVSSAESDPEKTTLDSTEVIDCVTEAIAQLEFPPPEGDGIVIVHYPFAFAQ